VTALCRFCEKASQLRKSHIVPEFLHRDLYNDKGHMMGVNGYGPKGWRPLQRGLTEPLLCESCEQFFNEHFEKPFRRMWIDQAALPSLWPEVPYYTVQVEYAALKLFHLSVLYRAGITTSPTFADVELGPHESRIRDMLRARDPGPHWKYPTMGVALYRPGTREIVQLVTKPFRERMEGQRCYVIAYGGVLWWIATSSHPSKEWLSASATESGVLILGGMPWTELGFVKNVTKMLGRADA
jgi:hypothetical protein